jgi:hypothetical protein
MVQGLIFRLIFRFRFRILEKEMKRVFQIFLIFNFSIHTLTLNAQDDVKKRLIGVWTSTDKNGNDQFLEFSMDSMMVKYIYLTADKRRQSLSYKGKISILKKNKVLVVYHENPFEKELIKIKEVKNEMIIQRKDLFTKK